MKILLVAHIRDSSGWAQAAIDYALALDSVGVDVVVRCINLGGNKPVLPERILELENKSASGADVVLQHVLPHLFDRNGHDGQLLNVGMYATETSNFTTAWVDRINTMDLAVVFNRQSKAASLKSGVATPVVVVPHALDMTRFQRRYEPLDTLKPQRDRGEFTFYTIGEMVRRKNLQGLLKAYHLEFDPSEPVNLCIKTSKAGLSPKDCHEAVSAFCHEIKRGLKLHGGRIDAYRPEIVITDRLTPVGIMRLHAACDVFVQPSYGEAASLPAMDALAMGKTPVVSACTGYLEYVSEANGWLVPTHPEPVFGVDDTFPDLFVGDECWECADIGVLRRCMREAYENTELRKKKSKAGISQAYDFSYEAIGEQLKGVLLEQLQTLDRSPPLG